MRDHPPERWRPTDLEAYCFLKKFLPPEYTIQSEPSAAYFSEGSFRYLISRGGEPFEELSGEFGEIEPGSLAARAIKILERVTSE